LNTLRIIAYAIIAVYVLAVVLLFLFQRRLIFFPGKLPENFNLKLKQNQEELFLTTSDDEHINAIFCQGNRDEVVLYFHGNAGDLSGWKFVAEDFDTLGYSMLIIDYRGYGKSSGQITEEGFYNDGEAAYNYLLQERGYKADQILMHGRSIGTGVAVEMAARHTPRALVLESPYTSLGALANEKLPFLFPSLYMRFSFNNLKKIGNIPCPVVMVHGTRDELIPPAHSERLFKAVTGPKKRFLINGGGHNDLNAFEGYKEFLNYLSLLLNQPV
jgi:fermentation-respiration switch protein FrsA (DUF1100 family)